MFVIKHGGIHTGDALAYVNDINLGALSHNDAVAYVNDPNTLKKEFKFCNPTEYYRKKYDKL